MTDVRRSSVAALDRFEVNIASSGLAPWVLTPWTIHDTRSDLGGANSCMDFESKKRQDYPEGTAPLQSECYVGKLNLVGEGIRSPLLYGSPFLLDPIRETAFVFAAVVPRHWAERLIARFDSLGPSATNSFRESTVSSTSKVLR